MLAIAGWLRNKPQAGGLLLCRPYPPLFIGSTSAQERKAMAGVCWFLASGFMRLQASLHLLLGVCAQSLTVRDQSERFVALPTLPPPLYIDWICE